MSGDVGVELFGGIDRSMFFSVGEVRLVLGGQSLTSSAIGRVEMWCHDTWPSTTESAYML
jgi:hypothetical protein